MSNQVGQSITNLIIIKIAQQKTCRLKTQSPQILSQSLKMNPNSYIPISASINSQNNSNSNNRSYTMGIQQSQIQNHIDRIKQDIRVKHRQQYFGDLRARAIMQERQDFTTHTGSHEQLQSNNNNFSPHNQGTYNIYQQEMPEEAQKLAVIHPQQIQSLLNTSLKSHQLIYCPKKQLNPQLIQNDQTFTNLYSLVNLYNIINQLQLFINSANQNYQLKQSYNQQYSQKMYGCYSVNRQLQLLPILVKRILEQIQIKLIYMKEMYQPYQMNIKSIDNMNQRYNQDQGTVFMLFIIYKKAQTILILTEQHQSLPQDSTNSSMNQPLVPIRNQIHIFYRMKLIQMCRKYNVLDSQTMGLLGINTVKAITY